MEAEGAAAITELGTARSWPAALPPSRTTAMAQKPCNWAAVDNTDLGTSFSTWKVGSSSETLVSNDIIVKYDYTGDFNLAGAVNANDYKNFVLDYGNGTGSTSAADPYQL